MVATRKLKWLGLVERTEQGRYHYIKEERQTQKKVEINGARFEGKEDGGLKKKGWGQIKT